MRAETPVRPGDRRQERAATISRVYHGLWLTFVAIAVYGSTYPFNFVPHELSAGEIRWFLDSCCRLPSTGDMLGNILLFVPIGLFGMLSDRADQFRLSRYAVVALLGLLLALALQIAQFYLPGRDESLQDVLWNFTGLSLGAGGVYVGRRVHGTARLSTLEFRPLPLTLILMWVALRLFPYVPSIDFQEIKESLKPLLLHPELVPLRVFTDAVSWLVVGYLLRVLTKERRFDALLPLMVGLLFSLEVLVAYNSLSASNVVGAGIALLVWWAALREVRHLETPLVFLLLVSLVAEGVWPLMARFQSVEFSWVPFSGFLHGSMLLNVLVAIEKVFVYGSLSYLVIRTGFSSLVGAATAFGVLLAIEVSQMYLVGHTPEITDPLMFAGLLSLAVLVERRGGESRRGC